MKKIITLSYLTAVFATTAVQEATAQQNFGLYAIAPVEQRIQLNPAFIPEKYNVHVGLPVLSSNYFSIGNSGFSYNDLIRKGGDDSLHLHMGEMVDQLKEKNYLSMSFSADLLTFGMRIKNGYVNLSVTERFLWRFRYPKDFFDFVWYGNTKRMGDTYNFNFGLDVSHYREFGLGYAHPLLDDKLVVGGKFKFIQGVGNFETRKSDIFVRTDPDDVYALTASGDITLNASGFEKNEDGDFIFSTGDYPLHYRNFGWGADLGANFNLTDNLSVNAAVTDLGFINWKSNVVNFTSSTPGKEFTFKGVPISDYVDEGDSSVSDGLSALGDTIIKTFQLDTTFNAYRTPLSTQYRVGAQMKLPLAMAVGGHFYFHTFDGKFFPGLSLFYSKDFGRWFTGVLSYTMYNRSWNNVGLGLRINMGPVQWYLVSDNIIAPFIPHKTKYFNLRGGINLTFGDPDKKKPDAAPRAQ